PAIYVSMHAASDGRGVRVYTALLPSSGENNGPFIAWNTAQSQFLMQSQMVAQGVAAELQKKQVPKRTLSAPVRPLNNVTTAAIAVEIAPPGTDVMDLSMAGYQQNVASAVANAIAGLRNRLGTQ